MSLQQFDERNPALGHVNFTSSYVPTTLENLVTPSDVPIRVDSIVGVNRNGAGINADFWLQVSGTSYFLGTAVLPAFAGQANTPIVDCLSVLTTSDQKFLLITPGQILQASLESAPTAGNQTDIWARGGTL